MTPTTPTQPATDAEVANAKVDGFRCDCPAGDAASASAPRYTGHQRSCAATLGPRMVARIEADRLLREELVAALEDMLSFDDDPGTREYAAVKVAAEEVLAKAQESARAQAGDVGGGDR